MLSFIDFQRMDYWDAAVRPYLRSGQVSEINVGDYETDDGVGPGGEFKIELYNFSHGRKQESLSVRLCVFDDAYGALREFIELRGLEATHYTKIRDHNDMSRILVDLGLRDLSQNPLPKGSRA